MPVKPAATITIFDAADDSTSDQFELPIGENVDDRFTGTLFTTGTFDSATAKLQVSADPITTTAANSAWVDVANADTITANNVVNVEFKAQKIRGNIAGSVTAASITMKLLI